MRLAKYCFRLLGRVFLLWLIYFFICTVIPPLFHKTALPEDFTAVEADADEDTLTLGGDAAGDILAPDSDTAEYAVFLPDGGAQERVMSIDNNSDALLWRLRLIEAARERVVLSTFDFRDDNSGQDIMAALFHSAERGVKVQILVDGMFGVLHLSGSESFRELAECENVEVKLYNPITLLMPWKNNYRMHDKYLIADDFAYILGGRNTDDLFLGNYVDSYNEDRDILVYETVPGAGSSFKELQEYFERIWNQPCAKSYKKQADGFSRLEAHYQEVREKYPQAFTEPKWEEVTMETQGVRLYTNPIDPCNKHPQLWQRLVEEMEGEDDILIQTPYIICDKAMYRDLARVCGGGAKAELIINAVESGTNPFGCTDYLNQKKKVSKTGIHTYEYLGEQALHTKTVLAGTHISIVGSCNFDMRSIYLDTEMMLRIDCEELNGQLRKQAEILKKKSRHVSPEGVVTSGRAYQAREQGTGKKIFYGVLRALIVPFRHLL